MVEFKNNPVEPMHFDKRLNLAAKSHTDSNTQITSQIKRKAEFRVSPNNMALPFIIQFRSNDVQSNIEKWKDISHTLSY